MQCRQLTTEDVVAAWEINEQGLPGTGQVSHEEMADLFSLCELAIGMFAVSYTHLTLPTKRIV